MKQFNYPTTIYFGEGSLEKGMNEIVRKGYKRPLLVTDKTLTEVGLVQVVSKVITAVGLDKVVFDGTHGNPIEEDVEKGAAIYNENGCDCLIALGGGSPMDTAKVIAIAVSQEGPLAQFDDSTNGSELISGDSLPPSFAIPTTAGTGSEVGRCGVIILRDTGDKTIFFHPKLLPELAILEPKLLEGLPPGITAATGIDALTHSLEAFFAPGFDPMADGIALESIHLILKNLKVCVEEGNNLRARGEMLMAATMGATAFQKGLGMIHSLAHPLSSDVGLHHGLANALMLPDSVRFIEESHLNADQRSRVDKVLELFRDGGLVGTHLWEVSRKFIDSVGIQMGLRNYGVSKESFDLLSKKAFIDVCHQTNMIPVSQLDLKSVYEKAY